MFKGFLLQKRETDKKREKTNHYKHKRHLNGQKQNMVDKLKWRNKYKKLCQELFGMDKFEAERHFQSSGIFDYGYSAFFYITEETNCGFSKRKESK